MKYPKYIKTVSGYIGKYAYLTVGNRPVYKFESGEYKFRAATEEEISSGSDTLNDFKSKTKCLMKWEQINSSVWEAVGKYGKFRIERSGGRFWSTYASEDTQHKLHPTYKLSEAKDKCERHPMWEDAV